MAIIMSNTDTEEISDLIKFILKQHDQLALIRQCLLFRGKWCQCM